MSLRVTYQIESSRIEAYAKCDFAYDMDRRNATKNFQENEEKLNKTGKRTGLTAGEDHRYQSRLGIENARAKTRAKAPTKPGLFSKVVGMIET